MATRSTTSASAPASGSGHGLPLAPGPTAAPALAARTAAGFRVRASRRTAASKRARAFSGWPAASRLRAAPHLEGMSVGRSFASFACRWAVWYRPARRTSAGPPPPSLRAEGQAQVVQMSGSLVRPRPGPAKAATASGYSPAPVVDDPAEGGGAGVVGDLVQDAGGRRQVSPVGLDHGQHEPQLGRRPVLPVQEPLALAAGVVVPAERTVQEDELPADVRVTRDQGGQGLPAAGRLLVPAEPGQGVQPRPGPPPGRPARPGTTGRSPARCR